MQTKPNIKSKPWLAFFSQTGSELLSITKELGITPDLICTNNPAYHTTELFRELNGKVNFFFRNKWTVDTYIDSINRCDKLAGNTDINKIVPSVCTLHGWLRIIPEEACVYAAVVDMKMYNGHPALVSLYPELKGKDMQEAVINEVEKYPWIGSIIHEVIAEVDAGDIIHSASINNFFVYDRNVIYIVLKDISLHLWLKFIPTILC